ncbi:MAG: hypothetical protein EP305_04430 [Bacteroidetes bacterium]|nr:MAG: hypothetical protein EP305_04430 [Bacteroidota bacterium]
MNWINFKTDIKDNFSQTYNIVVREMDIRRWSNFLTYLKLKGYFKQYETTEFGISIDIQAQEIVDYFNSEREYWPSLEIDLNGFRIDGFIKSAEHLELWFNDRGPTELTEENYIKITGFIEELSNELKCEVLFENEDALSERLIFKVDNGVIK